MLTAFLAAIQRMRRRPLRSILTILAVALGSLAVTLALNLMQSRALASLPSDSFHVVSGMNGTNGWGSWYSLFVNTDLDKIRKLVPDAEVIEAFQPDGFNFVEYNNQRFKIFSTMHVNPEYSSIAKLEMVQGSFFTKGDLQGKTKPILLAQTVARQVFGIEDPMGKTLRMSNSAITPGAVWFEPYRVIGIFNDPPSMAAGGCCGVYMYVPMSDPPNRFAEPMVQLLVKAKPGLQQTARTQVLEAIKKIYSGDQYFDYFNGAVYTTTSNNITETETKFDPQALLFAGFAIIMLITCSVGIFSIQLVDISERTREIGMRRALGATRSNIVLEVLTSAFVLAGSGAIIGVLLAAPALNIIKNLTGSFLFSNGLEFSPVVALEVVAIVLVVGVMLGFYPALLASRLKPVEALREM
jgi:putative ABC transport system permease protein